LSCLGSAARGVKELDLSLHRTHETDPAFRASGDVGQTRLQLALEGTPTVLVSHGKPDRHALQRARVDLEDVLESAREQGLERLDQIKFAILEVGGTISIVPQRLPSRPAGS
jgi:hypothetical protein